MFDRKEYMKKYNNEYWLKNKERLSTEEKRECGRIHYYKNREHLLKQKHKYYLENKERLLAYRKAYHETHKKEDKAKQKKYWASTKGMLYLRRQALMRRSGKSVDDLNLVVFVNKIRFEGINCCENCGLFVGKNYHIDHIIPLARGGKNNFDNFQLLCPTCNLEKSTKTIDYRGKSFVGGGLVYAC